MLPVLLSVPLHMVPVFFRCLGIKLRLHEFRHRDNPAACYHSIADSETNPCPKSRLVSTFWMSVRLGVGS